MQRIRRITLSNPVAAPGLYARTRYCLENHPDEDAKKVQDMWLNPEIRCVMVKRKPESPDQNALLAIPIERLTVMEFLEAPAVEAPKPMVKKAA